MPFVGARPVATAKFITACKLVNITNPKMVNVENESEHCHAMRMPKYKKSINKVIRKTEPMNPVSSAIMEKIKSVCCIGK